MPRFKKRRTRRYRPSAPPHGGVIRLLPRPRVEINRSLAWYCLWTTARAERRVEDALTNVGVAAYVPIEAIERTRRGRIVEDERPAVSRYVFVGLHGASPQWDAVHEALDGPAGWMAGVPSLGRVLKSRDGEALRVPASDLQRLADGLSLFGDESTSRKRFAAGGACRAIDGPFASFRGIVESSDDFRVRALLDVFGRKTSIEFSVDQLEAA